MSINSLEDIENAVEFSFSSQNEFIARTNDLLGTQVNLFGNLADDIREEVEPSFNEVVDSNQQVINQIIEESEQRLESENLINENLSSIVAINDAQIAVLRNIDTNTGESMRVIVNPPPPPRIVVNVPSLNLGPIQNPLASIDRALAGFRNENSRRLDLLIALTAAGQFGQRLSNPSRIPGNIAAARRFVGSFQEGIDFVPETGLALIHRGERVVPASQNSFSPTLSVSVRIGSITTPRGANASEVAEEVSRRIGDDLERRTRLDQFMRQR